MYTTRIFHLRFNKVLFIVHVGGHALYHRTQRLARKVDTDATPRDLGTDVTIWLSPAQQRKRVQDNTEAVADLIRLQDPENLKQVIRDAAKNRHAALRSAVECKTRTGIAWQALEKRSSMLHDPLLIFP